MGQHGLSEEQSFKISVRHKAWRAVKKGDLVRPDSCECCGKKTKPEGHHPDYNKALEVLWLCKRCHSDIHCRVLFTDEVELSKEDEAKWKAIENRAEWLHLCLNPDLGFEGLKDIVDDRTSVTTVNKIYRTNYDGTYKEDVTDTFFDNEPTIKPAEEPA